MAAFRCKHLYRVINKFSILQINCRNKNLIKDYSQYAPAYKLPIFRLDEVNQEVKKYSQEEIDAMMVRAAPNDKTCSVFFDYDVSQFINYVMRKGKKEVARNQVRLAFAVVKHIQIRKYNQEKDEKKKSEIILDPLKVFKLAVKNATPVLKATKIKKSGTWYSVPMGITDKYAKFCAMRWIVEVSKDKDPDKDFFQSLGEELVLSSLGEGKAVKKKIELHKHCENNRSYAHYKFT